MQVVFIIIIILSQVLSAEKTLSAFTLNVLHVVVCLCYFKRSEKELAVLQAIWKTTKVTIDGGYLLLSVLLHGKKSRHLSSMSILFCFCNHLCT